MAHNKNGTTSIWCQLLENQEDSFGALKAVKDARAGAFARGDFQAVHYLQSVVTELMRTTHPEAFHRDATPGDVLALSGLQAPGDHREN